MRFVRYVAVQVVAYGLDLGGFLLLFAIVGVGPLASNAFGKVAAGVFAFFAHRSFTFGVASDRGQGSSALKYFLLLALNIPLSSAALSLVLLALPHPVPAKFISDVLCVLVTYWLSKRYVFAGRAGEGGAGSAAGADAP